MVVNIVYASSGEYLLPVSVSVASALAWVSDRSLLRVHIIDCGITDGEWDLFENGLRQRFGNAFGLIRYHVDGARFNGFRLWHGSLATYARVVVADIILDAEWCIYCDGDTLWVNDPLILADVYNDEFAIQGHSDFCGDEHIKWFVNRSIAWRPEQYVCCGFLLINLNWFRKNNGVKRCLDFLRDYLDVPYADQDALYAVCQGHIGILPDEWGVFSSNAFSQNREGLIHFANNIPWKLKTVRARDYDDAFRLWYKYALCLMGYKRQFIRSRYGESRWLLAKKYIWRCVYKFLCPLAICLSASNNIFSRIYAHYNAVYLATSRWNKLTKCSSASHKCKTAQV